MRRLMFAAATAAIALAAAGANAADAVKPVAVPKVVAPAQAPVSGYVDIYGGWGWSSWHNSTAGNEPDSFGLFGGNGAVNGWLSPTTSAQLDVNAQATGNLVNAGYPDGEVYGSIGGHYSWRSAAHLFGLFAGASGTNELDHQGSNTQALIGVEGQIYSGNVTWYGQAGYVAALQSSTDFSANLAFARLVGRLFLNPNSKLQGEVGFASGKFSTFGYAGPDHVLNWGLSWEQQLPANPFSVFVSYSGYKVTGDPSYYTTQSQVVAGLKLQFGQGSLLNQDRMGATLDLPNTLLASQTWDYQDY